MTPLILTFFAVCHTVSRHCTFRSGGANVITGKLSAGRALDGKDPTIRV